jgi:GNAT superfamily N-acetyltransferase
VIGKRVVESSIMGMTYFKRYRMEFDLSDWQPRPCRPQDGYQLIGWRRSLLDAHASAKYRCFRGEIDSNVFPCLGNRDGCRRLMGEIASREGFVKEATWLVQYGAAGQRRPDYCGTVQGIRDRQGLGSIQNVGITPEHRGQGLGTCLVYKALDGFHRIGVKRVFLEVTAENVGAIRLYERMGFYRARTVYKAVEVIFA